MSLTQGCFLTVNPVSDSFVLFHQFMFQTRYSAKLMRALVTYFLTTTVPSFSPSHLTIQVQVAQLISQMFLIQTVILAVPKLYELLQFLFTLVHLLQQVHQFGQTFLPHCFSLFGLMGTSSIPSVGFPYLSRPFIVHSMLENNHLNHSTFLLEEKFSSTFDWISVFAQFAQHLACSNNCRCLFQLASFSMLSRNGCCRHNSFIFWIVDEWQLIFLSPSVLVVSHVTDSFCYLTHQFYTSCGKWRGRSLTFLGSSFLPCVIFSHAWWNDSSFGLESFSFIVLWWNFFV